MSKKYKFNKSIIKRRLQTLRKNANLTQKQVANALHLGDPNDKVSRTTITTWESDANETLPNFSTMIDLCNLFNADIDYLLGKTNIKSHDIKAIAETTHLSEETIIKLQDKPNYGDLINYLVDSDLLEEIVYRTKQLSQTLLLKDLIITSFTKEFENSIHTLFNNFYYSTFPMDITENSYINYLKAYIPLDLTFDSQTFINKNFLYDGKIFIYNQCNDFSNLSLSLQYDLIIKSISAISYEYYMSQTIYELSLNKLTNKLLNIIISIIENKTEMNKAIIKERINNN